MNGPHLMLLPYATTPLVARSGAATTGSRRRLAIGVAVVADGARQGTPAMTQVELSGAGDITALDPATVTRVEPSPGVRGVEPNYFPHVEFADADLPWRYSLGATAGNRGTPWIALVALRDDEFRFVGTGAALGAIEVLSPATSLPDLSQSWAWGHVQVDLTESAASAAELQKILDERPDAHFSRLLCARRLQPDTSYSLFLVPTFEAGRLRGLAEPGPASPWDAWAWSGASTGAVRLPYYAQWRFTTSASEDFESLVRRIEPADLDQVGGPGLAGLQVRAGEPGYYTGYLDAGARFEAEGALRTPGFDDRRASFAANSLSALVKSTINLTLAVAETATADSATAEDPLFTLPAYGRHHAKATSVDVPGGNGAWPAPSPWMSEVNLDLRYRLAAGMGARSVRANQEALMARCWDQVGAILEANRLIAQAGAASVIGTAVARRHVLPLPANVGLTLSEPLHPVVAGPAKGLAISKALPRLGVPGGVMSVAERKLHAKRPARTQAGATARRGTNMVPPAPGLPGAGYGGADRDAAEGINVAIGTAPPADAAGLRQRGLDWSFSVFPEVDAAQASRLLDHEVTPEFDELQIAEIDIESLRDTIVGHALSATTQRIEQLISGIDKAELVELDPIQRGPRIADAMYVHLAAQDPELLCPGIAGLPRERAGLLVENRRFIEAFLAGANHEMTRELVWREFPSDVRATVFARMWERGAEPEDETADDIKPLASWSGALGSNGRGPSKENVVLVVRAELAKRYPGFRIALNRQKSATGTWAADAGTDFSPVFSGTIGDDIRYFGFPVDEKTLHNELERWFVVIYEPPGRYRFGLDVASFEQRSSRRDLSHAAVPFPVASSAAVNRAVSVILQEGPAPGPGSTAAPGTWADLSWSNVPVGTSGYVDFGSEVHPGAGDTGEWGAARTSATLASVTFQQPARVVIAAARMLGDA